MFVERKQKFFKRWQKAIDRGELLIAIQSRDLKNDIVRRVSFFIPKDTFKSLESSKESYDFSQYHIREIHKDPKYTDLEQKYMVLSKYVKTKKLTKINQNSYLQLYCYDAYRFSDYITVNETIIKGKRIENLIFLSSNLDEKKIKNAALKKIKD